MGKDNLGIDRLIDIKEFETTANKMFQVFGEWERNILSLNATIGKHGTVLKTNYSSIKKELDEHKVVSLESAKALFAKIAALEKEKKALEDNKKAQEDNHNTHKETVGTVNKLKEKLKELKRNYDELEIATEKDIKAQEKLAAEFRETKMEMDKFTSILKVNKKQLETVTGSYDNLVERNKKLSIELKSSADGLSNNSDQVRKMKKEYAENDKKIKDFNASLKISNQTISNQKSKLSRSTEALINYTVQLGVAYASLQTLANAARFSFNAFTDFEFGMKKVQVISGATQKEFKALEKNAKLLGSTTQFTASNVADLELELSKLGLTPPQILKATKAILGLAGAFDEDLGKTASVVASAMNAFGLEAKDTTMIANVMARAFAGSALDLEKISVAFRQVAPVAKSLGFGLKDTTALLGALVDAGFDASQAGTSLRAIFLKMAQPTSDLSKALGRTVHSTVDLLPALIELREKGIDLAGAFNLTGKTSVAAFNLFLDGAEKVGSLREKLDDTSKTAEGFNTQMQQTAKGGVKGLESAAEGLAIQMFEYVAPSFNAAVKTLTNFILGLKEAPKFIEDNKEEITVLVATLIALKVATITSTSALAGATLAQKAHTLAVNLGTRAQKLLKVTMLSTPWGAAIAAIGTITVALISWSKKTEEVIAVNKHLADINKEVNKQLIEQKVSAEQLFEIAKDETLTKEDRARAMKKINEQYKDLLPFMLTEKSRLEDISNAEQLVIDGLEKRIKIQIATEKITALKRSALEREAKTIDGFIKSNEEYLKSVGLSNLTTTRFTSVLDALARSGRVFGDSLKGLSLSPETLAAYDKMAKSADLFRIRVRSLIAIRNDEKNASNEITKTYITNSQRVLNQTKRRNQIISKLGLEAKDVQNKTYNDLLKLDEDFERQRISKKLGLSAIDARKLTLARLFELEKEFDAKQKELLKQQREGVENTAKQQEEARKRQVEQAKKLLDLELDILRLKTNAQILSNNTILNSESALLKQRIKLVEENFTLSLELAEKEKKLKQDQIKASTDNEKVKQQALIKLQLEFDQKKIKLEQKKDKRIREIVKSANEKKINAQKESQQAILDGIQQRIAIEQSLEQEAILRRSSIAQKIFIKELEKQTKFLKKGQITRKEFNERMLKAKKKLEEDITRIEQQEQKKRVEKEIEILKTQLKNENLSAEQRAKIESQLTSKKLQLGALITSMFQFNLEKSKEASGELDRQARITRALLQALQIFTDQVTDLISEKLTSGFDKQKEIYEAELEALKDFNEKQQEEIDSAKEERLESLDDEKDKTLAKLKKRHDAELKAAGKDEKKKTRLKEKYEKDRTKLEKGFEKQKKDAVKDFEQQKSNAREEGADKELALKRRIAETDKQKAIFTANVEMFVAIAKTLASVPFPASLVLAGAVAFEAQRNIAKIRRQKTGFKTGVDRLKLPLGVPEGDDTIPALYENVVPLNVDKGEMIVPTQVNKEMSAANNGKQVSRFTLPEHIRKSKLYDKILSHKGIIDFVGFPSRSRRHTIIELAQENNIKSRGLQTFKEDELTLVGEIQQMRKDFAEMKEVFMNRPEHRFHMDERGFTEFINDSLNEIKLNENKLKNRL